MPLSIVNAIPCAAITAILGLALFVWPPITTSKPSKSPTSILLGWLQQATKRFLSSVANMFNSRDPMVATMVPHSEPPLSSSVVDAARAILSKHKAKMDTFDKEISTMKGSMVKMEEDLTEMKEDLTETKIRVVDNSRNIALNRFRLNVAEEDLKSVKLDNENLKKCVLVLVFLLAFMAFTNY